MIILASYLDSTDPWMKIWFQTQSGRNWFFCGILFDRALWSRTKKNNKKNSIYKRFNGYFKITMNFSQKKMIILESIKKIGWILLSRPHNGARISWGKKFAGSKGGSCTLNPFMPKLKWAKFLKPSLISGAPFQIPVRGVHGPPHTLKL